MQSEADNKPIDKPALSKAERRSSFRRAAIIVLIAGALLTVAIALIDRYYIPYLEDETILVSRSWKEDCWKASQMSYQRWGNPNDCAILESSGIPVSQKKPKSKRILVSGDSFCGGFGLVNINDVWWRALQRELIRRGYNDVEVVGIVSGHLGSTAGQVKNVERWAGKYQADAVLFGYVVDDADELADRDFIVPHLKRYEPDAATKIIRRVARTLVPNLAEVLTSRQDKFENDKLSGPLHGYDFNQRELEQLKGMNLERYQETLQRMRVLVQQLKVPSYVIALPCVAGFYPEFDLNRSSEEYFDYLHAYYQQRYDGITPSFEKAKLRFVNLLEPYIALLKSQPQLKGRRCVAQLCANPADGHPSSFVTHFYACQVADLLERETPTVLGEKSAVIKKFPPKINDWMPPNANVYPVAKEQYVFMLPPNKVNQLFMPVREPHVQLNFEMPTALTTIRLRGPGLKRSTIWLSYVSPTDGYDTGVLHKLETKNGIDVSWQLPAAEWAQYVNTIKISAQVKGTDNRILLSF